MVYAEDSGITLNLNNITGNVTSVNRTITTTDEAKKPKAQASIVYIATVNDGDASITNNTKLKLNATYSSFLNSSGFILMGKTGSKTITDIATGTYTGFSVDKELLIQCGFAADDFDPKATEFYYAHFDFTTKSGSVYGLLIQVVPAEVSKKSLEDALNALNLPSETDYYTENDKYNGGNLRSKTGFWAEMQGIIKPAKDVYEDPSATQGAVNNAVKYLENKDTIAALKTAIGNLISKQYVNATELDEFLGSYTKTEQGYDVKSQLPLKQADYPAARWQAFEDAMTSARALLDALYKTDSKTGAVTPSARNWGPNRPDENKPEDAITNETLASALTTIRTALSGLVSEDDLKSADDARSYIRKLNTMFPAAQQGSYTDASWKKFVAARDKANALLESIRLRRISRMMPPQARSELHTPIITKPRMV